MMARLGMRAGEVRQLNLNDIDWIKGEIHVRAGKSDVDDSGDDHTAPTNGHFLAGLDPPDSSSSVTAELSDRVENIHPGA
jgi:hypothetical protein